MAMEEDDNDFEDNDFEDDGFEDDGFEDDGKDDGWEDGDDDGWGDDKDDDGWGGLVTEDQTIEQAPREEMKRQVSVIKALTSDDITDAVNEKVNILFDSLADDDTVDITKRECLLLLRRYKWNPQKIMDVYFTDKNKILVGAGVCIDKKKNIINDKNKNNVIECGVCMDDVKMSDTFCLECGHLNTCKSCWVDYLRDGVKTKQCVHLTCPTHKCYVTIPQDVWQLFLADKHKEEFKRYQRFCRENFVEVKSIFYLYLRIIALLNIFIINK